MPPLECVLGTIDVSTTGLRAAKSESGPQAVYVTLTAFYAVDQEKLDRKHWDLADVYADLHDLVTDGTQGVARITMADLLLALEGWNHLDDEQRWREHRNAVRRITDALGDSARAVF
jgi:hypothetical protein